MAGAVLAHQPGAVERQEHRHVVLADVMDEAVVRALAERRVERDDRPHAGEAHAGGHRHGVLLGDPDVVEAGREVVAEALTVRSRWASPR